jgi:hypothetical protein
LRLVGGIAASTIVHAEIKVGLRLDFVLIGVAPKEKGTASQQTNASVMSVLSWFV